MFYILCGIGESVRKKRNERDSGGVGPTNSSLWVYYCEPQRDCKGQERRKLEERKENRVLKLYFQVLSSLNHTRNWITGAEIEALLRTLSFGKLFSFVKPLFPLLPSLASPPIMKCSHSNLHRNTQKVPACLLSQILLNQSCTNTTGRGVSISF